MTEEEVENIRKFGYPFVKEKFKPHITLAYDSKGLVIQGNIIGKPWELTIDNVLFAEIGKYGSVTRTIEV